MHEKMLVIRRSLREGALPEQTSTAAEVAPTHYLSVDCIWKTETQSCVIEKILKPQCLQAWCI